MAIHLPSLIEGNEVDLFRGKRIECERPFNGIQVMGSYCDQRPLSCQILMKLVLKSDERVISLLCELDTPQDGTRAVLSYFSRLFLYQLTLLLANHCRQALTFSVIVRVSSSPLGGGTRR